MWNIKISQIKLYIPMPQKTPTRLTECDRIQFECFDRCPGSGHVSRMN